MAERNAVIHQVYRARILAGAKVFRYQRKRLSQNVLMTREEHAQIDIRQQPLVRIHNDRVRSFHAAELYP